jgi:hypothetical protein
MKTILLALSHVAALAVGFGLGIYALPILTAPPPPTAVELSAIAAAKPFVGTFRRDLKDSDVLHWGEGKVYVSANGIALEGSVSPGPDYKLYLSPEFVETEADFKRLKARMVRVGDVKTFNNFIVPLPASVDPAKYTAVIIWCESFSEFITAAQYR